MDRAERLRRNLRFVQPTNPTWCTCGVDHGLGQRVEFGFQGSDFVWGWTNASQERNLVVRSARTDGSTNVVRNVISVPVPVHVMLCFFHGHFAECFVQAGDVLG